MIRTISAEWLKLRRSRIGFVIAVLPILGLLIGCANYSMNRGALQNGWYSLWTQVSLFYGEFFLPVLIAICCAYVCRLEHLNKNWNMMLSSPVSIAAMFFAKWIVIGVLILFAQALFMALYWLAGTLFSLGPFPMETTGWAMRGWYASLSVIALQLALSIRIRSFAVPIGVSLCAVFVGLGMHMAGLGLFFPFSLITIGMNVLNRDMLTEMQNILFWIMNMAYTIVFALVSVRLLKTNAQA